MARPKKKGIQKALNINIAIELANELDEVSDQTGLPKTKIVEKALKDYLKNNKEILKAVE